MSDKKKKVIVVTMQDVEEAFKIKVSKEEKYKINTKVLTNLLCATIILIYFLTLNYIFLKVLPDQFSLGMRITSLIVLAFTIIIFEVSYKSDSGEIAIYGIELLVLSIISLVLVYINIIFTNRFMFIVYCISGIFFIYYLLKSILIWVIMKKEYHKNANDIREIVKK